MSKNLIIHEFDILGKFFPRIPIHLKDNIKIEDNCEKEILTFSKCILQKDEEVNCFKEFKTFDYCRNNRDLKLFNSIKKEEIKFFKKLDIDKRKDYWNNIKEELDERNIINKEIKQINDNREKILRVKSDIEQLNWRINYLLKLDK